LCNHRRHSLSLKSNNNSDLDPIETRLNALGLKLPKPLKIASNIQIPFAWVRVRLAGFGYIQEIIIYVLSC
jgi:hypothetical protein